MVPLREGKIADAEVPLIQGLDVNAKSAEQYERLCHGNANEPALRAKLAKRHAAATSDQDKTRLAAKLHRMSLNSPGHTLVKA